MLLPGTILTTGPRLGGEVVVPSLATGADETIGSMAPVGLTVGAGNMIISIGGKAPLQPSLQ